MCGILGAFSDSNFNGQKIMRCLEHMASRGPDDEGYLDLEKGKRFAGESTAEQKELDHIRNGLSGKWFGHRRLAVTGDDNCKQPMSYKNLSLTYEGEIYNYKEVRHELKEIGHNFDTNGDTEVFLHAFDEWGVDCVKRFKGKWAAGIYNSNSGVLYCLRDHFGTKPLYYFKEDGRFFFSSTIAPILELREEKPSEDVQAKLDYLIQGLADHSRRTFFENIKQLRPGEYLKYSESDIHIHELPEKNGSNNTTLRDACVESIRSKIPETDYCITLSGGLDSSIVASVLAGENPDTYSANIEDGSHEDPLYRDKVTEQNDLHLKEVPISNEEVIDLIEETMDIQEEPSAVMPLYAQNLLFKKINEDGHRVVITGTGSDELFLGYPHFIPPGIAESFKKEGLKEGFQLFLNHLPRLSVGDILLIISILLPFTSEEFLKSKIGRKRSNKLVEKPESYAAPTLSQDKPLQELIQMQLKYSWFPSIMRQTDKNAGAYGLEVREGFLSQELLNHIQNSEPLENIRNGRTKRTLRKCFEDILPQAVVARKNKVGFMQQDDSMMSDSTKRKFLKKFKSEKFRSRNHINHDKVIESLESDNMQFITAYRLYSYEVWARKFID